MQFHRFRCTFNRAGNIRKWQAFNKRGNAAAVVVVLFGVGIPLFIQGCSSTGSSDGGLRWEPREISEPGAPYAEFQSFPDFRDTSGVEIVLSVVPANLIYLKSPPGFRAELDIQCRILSTGSDQLVSDEGWIDSLWADTYENTRTHEEHTVSRFLPAPPGSYDVEVKITDPHSGRSWTGRRSVKLQDHVTSGIAGGPIRLFLRNAVRMRPVLGPSIPSSGDTLVCSIPLYNVPKTAEVTTSVHMISFGRDTSLPTPPYAFNALSGSLEYASLNIASPETLATLTLRNTASTAAWDWPVPPEGVYAISAEVVVGDTGGARAVRIPLRPLAVFHRGFPRPVDLTELVGSVEYLVTDADRDSLYHSRDAGKRRTWLERFWLAGTRNREEASNVLDRYYTRVEEANTYFSSFRPGWQTDRGMIYIIFGPPLNIQKRLDGEYWSYSPSGEEALKTFRFRKIPLPEPLDVFDHYILERQGYYDIPWLDAVERWRRGIGY